MEGYPGAVILATNFRRNIDDAFVRRLDFVIDFPFPEPEDRNPHLEEGPARRGPARRRHRPRLPARRSSSSPAARSATARCRRRSRPPTTTRAIAHAPPGRARSRNEYGKQGRLTLEADFERFHEVIRVGGRANGACAHPATGSTRTTTCAPSALFRRSGAERHFRRTPIVEPANRHRRRDAPTAAHVRPASAEVLRQVVLVLVDQAHPRRPGSTTASEQKNGVRSITVTPQPQRRLDRRIAHQRALARHGARARTSGLRSQRAAHAVVRRRAVGRRVAQHPHVRHRRRQRLQARAMSPSSR